MTKKILFFILFLLCLQVPVRAEKIPVKIAPIQVISTKHDEVEVGDWINFEVVKDVYMNDNLFIKKGTDLIGIVDYVHPNGWAGDCAQITFKTFKTSNSENQKVEIPCTLVLEGNSEAANGIRYFASYLLGNIFRGPEIFIEPDTKIYNIFIVK